FNVWIFVALLLAFAASGAIWLTLRHRASHTAKTADGAKKTPYPWPSAPAPQPSLTPKDYDAINHQKIEFYGEIVDQDGLPVPEVTVFLTVYYNSTGGSGVRKVTQLSGADGHFTVTGYEGRTLDV